MFEGLPAAGKTTLARAMQQQFGPQHCAVEFFREETCQPVDLFRQAVFLPEEYAELLRLPEAAPLAEMLAQNTRRLGPYFVTAYLQLPFSENAAALRQLFRSHDIGDGRASFETYRYLHLLLWEQFVAEYGSTSSVIITEGVMLQNQLLDLVGFYELPEAALLRYFRELFDILRPLKPKLHYIYLKNIETTLLHALQERGTDVGSWGCGFETWLAQTPYGKRKHLCGVSGMLSCCLTLQALSLSILECSNLDCEIIERD